MAESPEYTSTNRRLIVAGFAIILGGFLSLVMLKYGAFTVPRMFGAILVGASLGWLADSLMLRGAASLIGNIYATGNIAPAPSYPVAELHVVRWKFAEAAEHYREHLAGHPEDYEARLRLADLSVAHLGNHDEAERLYKEVRDAREDKRREARAFNSLIDLYSKLGRKDRLKVELSRFADRYAGSPQAADARRRLDELKSDV